MRSIKKFSEDKQGVFGLTSVQAFFAIVLGLTLLAYVIIVIMGTLSNSVILPSGTLSASVVNETTTIAIKTGVPYSLSGQNKEGCQATVTAVANQTFTLAGQRGPDANNFTVNNCFITEKVLSEAASPFNNSQWNVTYSYTYNSPSNVQAQGVLGNTSSGITGFFSGVNPVYAILAILVIILVLVVLVRVVSGGTSLGGGKARAEPQL